jgi:hypothetical protein
VDVLTEELLEGRVLFVTPLVPSAVLVPLELIIVPLFELPVASVRSFAVLYPCLEERLP